VHLIDPEKKIEIRQLPLKKYHGAVWHIGDRWIIYLNSNDTPGRRRVALFHEYFHILASCNAKTSFSDTKITYSKINRRCLVTEIMADAFAANLLIPQEWLENNFPKIGNVKQISEICNVAYTLTYFKLKLDGLIT
jgi:Zn-dependent peptidase ImmA (M78 family)